MALLHSLRPPTYLIARVLAVGVYSCPSILEEMGAAVPGVLVRKRRRIGARVM